MMKKNLLVIGLTFFFFGVITKVYAASFSDHFTVNVYQICEPILIKEDYRDKKDHLSVSKCINYFKANHYKIHETMEREISFISYMTDFEVTSSNTGRWSSFFCPGHEKFNYERLAEEWTGFWQVRDQNYWLEWHDSLADMMLSTEYKGCLLISSLSPYSKENINRELIKTLQLKLKFQHCYDSEYTYYDVQTGKFDNALKRAIINFQKNMDNKFPEITEKLWGRPKNYPDGKISGFIMYSRGGC